MNEGNVVRLASLEIQKDVFSFAAGHFTVFSATEREYMHGHTYQVSVGFEFRITENGLSFDYRHYKQKMRTLCAQLDKFFLLPTQSPYLRIEDDGEYWVAHFNHKKMPFLKEDVVLLPITNITIEELSYWFLQQLLDSRQEIEDHVIHRITVKVYNGPGQAGGATWEEGHEDI